MIGVMFNKEIPPLKDVFVQAYGIQIEEKDRTSVHILMELRNKYKPKDLLTPRKIVFPFGIKTKVREEINDRNNFKYNRKR